MAPPLTPRSRRVPWPLLLVVLLLVVPTLEIAVIIAVGRAIGGWPTLALLLAESALGAWLVRREGTRSWRALTEALTTGRMPSHQLADAALVLVGGTLLLAPGFLTDLVGFFLILPPTRPVARRALESVVTRGLVGGLVGRWPGQPPDGPVAPDGSSGSRRPRDTPAASGPEDVIEGEVL